MKTRSQLLILSILLATLLAACSVSALSPTPTARSTEIVQAAIATPTAVSPTAPAANTQTATPTTLSPTSFSSNIPQPTVTLTPTLKYTLTPTANMPTATPRGWRIPSKEVGLVKGRQWFVFAGFRSGQIGGFNVDGTGMTWYDLPPVNSIYSCAICRIDAQKNFLAYLTVNKEANSVDLIVAKFPQGEVFSRIPIATLDYEDEDWLLHQSIGKMAWSPDGSMLAISAAPNRPNTDVYLYHRGANYVEQISSENSFSREISWSEDGNTIYYRSTRRLDDDQEYSLETVDTYWALDLKSGSTTVLKTAEGFEGGCGGDPSVIYHVMHNSDHDVKIIINNWYNYDLGDGVFIQTEEDEEPRLLLEASNYYHDYAWLWNAQRFIIGTQTEMIILYENGSIDFRYPLSAFAEYWDSFTLSPDRKMAALITSSGLLKIYELNDGFQEIWTVPEPVAVDKVYWYPDGTQLVVEGLGHVYHVDLTNQEITLLIYGGADRFSMDYGFWMSQQE